MAHSSGGSDPLMPLSSRFPLSPPGGRVTPNSALPSGPQTRPFGMRYAVRPIDCGRHSKEPTNKTRTDKTEYSDDNQFKVKDDVVHFVVMDEE